jgi:uncharacterized protein YkwD
MDLFPRSLRHGRSSLIPAMVLLAILAPLLPGCAPRPAHPPITSRQPRPDLQSGSLEQRIHDLVNQERRKHGLAPLAWDGALARIARSHSADMAKRGYFSHDSPEGHDFSQRYRTGGYSCSIQVGATVHLGGENIFQNNRYDSVTTMNGRAYYDWNSESDIAGSTVRGWMDSPGHRKNILTPYWQREGIGVRLTPENKIYITQNFC